MGGVFSSNSSFVAVQLEKPYYYPGEVLSGVLCLNVLEPLEARTLHVTAYAVEKTHWQESRTSNITDGNGASRSTHHTETYTQKHIIMDCRFPLGLPMGQPTTARWSGAAQVVPCGQYQWPFSFQLPHNLPPSWSFNQSQDYGNERQFPSFNAIGVLGPASKHGAHYGEIRYEVRAQCERPGFLTSDLRHSVPFGVMSLPSNVPPPKPVSSSSCQEAKVCCCIGRGVVDVHASLSKDVLVPGETASMVLEVNNASKTDVPVIEVHLLMHVQLSAHGRRHNINKTWCLASTAGVAAGQCCEGSAARTVQLKVPPCMPATHRGLISSCNYVLQVRLKTHSMARDIKMELPIVLCRTISSGAVGLPVAPDFWKPQVMPPFAWAAPGVPLPPVQAAGGAAAGYPAASGAGPSTSNQLYSVAPASAMQMEMGLGRPAGSQASDIPQPNKQR